jgi:hypothetical protein
MVAVANRQTRSVSGIIFIITTCPSRPPAAMYKLRSHLQNRRKAEASSEACAKIRDGGSEAEPTGTQQLRKSAWAQHQTPIEDRAWLVRLSEDHHGVVILV